MMMNAFRPMLLTLLSFLFFACSSPAIEPKEMIKVEGGSFTMGNADARWNPPHQVTLDSFLMAKYLVTIGELKLFLKESGLSFDWDWQDQYMSGTFRDIVPTDDCPAQGVNWYYAAAFCNWLSKRAGLQPAYVIEGNVDAYNGPGFLKSGKKEPKVVWNKNANGYRLPTDAEWEYAARGGGLSKDFRYAGSDDPNEIALYRQTKSYPVGKMRPNEVGLYDMGGNVSVWCWDWFDTKAAEWLTEKNPSIDLYKDVRQMDASNPFPMKVVRGFHWGYGQPVEVYKRNHYPPQNLGWIGIRLVRNAQ